MKWFVRKSIYVPTWPVFLGFLAALTGLALILVLNLYSWLALDAFVPSKDGGGEMVLVVEGWVPDSIVDEAVELYHQGEFDLIATTGGPTTGMAHLFLVESYAQFGADRLISRGVPSDQVIVSAAESVDRRRTLRSALDLKKKLESLSIMPEAMNILTSDVHARRSRMIYRRVFGKEISIGVRGGEPEDFDPESWWQTSVGIKTLALEVISLTYDWLAPRRS